jgi:hypothetical protein
MANLLDNAIKTRALPERVLSPQLIEKNGTPGVIRPP